MRGKVRAVTERAGLAPASHLGKALTHILETYPRDELFQISIDELAEIANGILQLGERQRFRLFVRHDAFERFVSCLIFVPRENYTTELRRKFQWILLEAFNGSAAEFDVLLTDEVLARIHITVRTTPGWIPPYDRRALEAQLAAAARRWEDDLREALNTAMDEAVGSAGAAALRFSVSGLLPRAHRSRERSRGRRLSGPAVAQRPRAAPVPAARAWRPGASASRSTAAPRRCRCRTRCRCWSTWACACCPSGPTRSRPTVPSRCGSTTSSSRRRPATNSTSLRWRHCSRMRSRVCSPGASRTTTSTASC